VAPYARASLSILAVSVALAFHAAAEAPPAGLMKRVAERETENEAARNQYMYRQTVVLSDFAGQFREVRDIIFSPTGTRTEEVIEKAVDTLKKLKMTEEDIRDIREIQPMLVTRETAFLYETKFRGDEQLNGIDCWLIQIRPRQILSGQRLFDGMLWVDKRDFSIIQSQGQAVPQIVTTKQENLFPHFTTIREKVDGTFWFPVTTYADDTLPFRNGPQRIRLTIRYANYKRFGAETRIEYK
jgi:hypothetical protein